MGIKVGVVGASGLVGSRMLGILQERKFPVESLRAFATSASAGNKVLFNNSEVIIEDVAQASFSGLDLVLMAGGEIASSQYAPEILKTGAWIIDNSNTYRRDPEVPLVVPEVNSDDLLPEHKLIANPNCTTIQMVIALKPIFDIAGLKRVNVTTFQSVSGTGKAAVEELRLQESEQNTGAASKPKIYPAVIAHNLFPHIGKFNDAGYCEEEDKIVFETRKIFRHWQLAITATCVRVPVIVGHSEAVNLTTEQPVSLTQIQTALKNFSGIQYCDTYVTPLEIEGSDPVWVGRVRTDESAPHSFNLWVVADNLRVGAALNAVRIAEVLLHRGWL